MEHHHEVVAETNDVGLALGSGETASAEHSGNRIGSEWRSREERNSSSLLKSGVMSAWLS